MNDEPEDITEGTRERPLQFRLRTLFVATALVAVLFSLLEWLDVPPRARVIILVVLGVSVLAAVALVAVIAGSFSRNAVGCDEKVGCDESDESHQGDDQSRPRPRREDVIE